MAYGGGVFLTQNKRLPGSYINFVGGNSSDKSSSKGTTIASFTMSIDEEGNLYVTFNKSAAVSFELDEVGNLYAAYDDESGISFELDNSGNLYILEE